MTPERALKICPDFLVTRNESGKMTCVHKRDELCMHPQHFLCDLVTYKKRMERKEQRGQDANGQDVPALSPSRIKFLEECARKYGFIYEHHAFSEGTAPEWKIVGNVFTVGRAKIDQGMDEGYVVDLSGKAFPFGLAKAKAVLDYYKAHPPYPVGSVICEIEVYISRDGFWFHGYLDAITEDGKTIREWKYAASKFTLLETVRQAAVYLLGNPKADVFELWRFPKPGQRPGADETPEAFYQRVRKALFEKSPEETYDVVRHARKNIPVGNIIRQMVSRMKTLPVLRERGYPPSYGRECPGCDYRAACENGLSHTTEEIATTIKLLPQLETAGGHNELTEPSKT